MVQHLLVELIVSNSLKDSLNVYTVLIYPSKLIKSLPIQRPHIRIVAYDIEISENLIIARCYILWNVVKVFC